MFWLTLKSISAGLFASEYTVELATTDGDLQVFVSKHQVDEGKKALKVQLLDRDERYALVQVPSQGGGSVAKVALAGVLSPA
jgi:hypothetical protein